MSKRVAILQSNYLPWKGYFDIIHDVDEFVFYDDRQYTKSDWRNRNRVKTPFGPAWMTIPVGTRQDRLICEVELPPGSWARKHRRLLEAHYAHAPYFDAYRAFLDDVYVERAWKNLSDLNQYLIRTIARDFLRIQTCFRDSRELELRGDRQGRLIEALQQLDADVYVSGPLAHEYIEPARFASCGIDVIWKNYSGYPEYPQFHPPFEHRVTVLDLLFHTGPEAARYIWGWRSERL